MIEISGRHANGKVMGSMVATVGPDGIRVDDPAWPAFWMQIRPVDQRASLISQIRAIVRHGEFKLASGKTSSYYINMMDLLMTGDGAATVGSLMASVLHKTAWDSIGGPASGCHALIPLCLNYLPGRRGWVKLKEADRQGGWFDGQIRRDDGIVLLDDVATTGGSMIAAARVAEEQFGCQIVAAGCILDREQGAAAAFAAEGIPFFSLAKISEVFPEGI